MPEMVFPRNTVRFEHDSGVALEFNARDALELLPDAADPHIKVAAAKTWTARHVNTKEADVMKVEKTFDWTYSTPYRGTLTAPTDKPGAHEAFGKAVPSPGDVLNLDLLRQELPIEFFDEVILFEDELADNGVAMLSAKIRVMPPCFFALVRLWIRVDGVLCRMMDTRVYHEFGKDYMLREYQLREQTIEALEALGPRGPPPGCADANLVYPHLPVRTLEMERISLTPTNPSPLPSAAPPTTAAPWATNNGGKKTPFDPVARAPWAVHVPPQNTTAPSPMVRPVRKAPPSSPPALLHRYKNPAHPLAKFPPARLAGSTGLLSEAVYHHQK